MVGFLQRRNARWMAAEASMQWAGLGQADPGHVPSPSGT